MALIHILTKCFRTWFSSSSKMTSQPTWTLSSLHLELTDPQRMPSPLPSTQFSHTLKITPTLLSIQHNSPMKLTGKFSTMSSSTTLWNWTFNFHTNRPQTVWIGGHTSSTMNTGAPQSCVLSPLLFTLYTHDCSLRHGENYIVKFVENTIIGQISKNDETS